MSSVLGASEWNVNALQQARWTQEVLLGTNSDKIPDAALALSWPTALVATLGVDTNVTALGVNTFVQLCTLSLAAGTWVVFGTVTFQHTATAGVAGRLSVSGGGSTNGNGVLVANTPLQVVIMPVGLALAATTTVSLSGTANVTGVNAKTSGVESGTSDATWMFAIRIK